MNKKWAIIFTTIVAGAFLLIPNEISIFSWIVSLIFLIYCIKNGGKRHA
jgi:hypothetical protein